MMSVGEAPRCGASTRLAVRAGMRGLGGLHEGPAEAPGHPRAGAGSAEITARVINNKVAD